MVNEPSQGETPSSDVVADFSPNSSDESREYMCILHNDTGSIDDCCDWILRSLEIHQTIYHSFDKVSVIHDGLLQDGSVLKGRLNPAFHRLVVLDVARGVAGDGAFDLAAFYRYAFEQMEFYFGITPSQTYHEQDLLQILKDEPASLICLVNVDAAESVERKRLRSLTQEGHASLIVFRKPNKEPSSQHLGSYCLEVDVLGDERGRKFFLDQQESTIGRHSDSTIVIDHHSVSRFHATVTHNSDGFVLEDSGSRDGTFLNRERLTSPQFLREGDLIQLGKVGLLFREIAFDGIRVNKLGDVEMDFVDSGEPMTASVETDRIRRGAASPETLQLINSALDDVFLLDEMLSRVHACLFDIFPAADRGFVVMRNECGELAQVYSKHRDSDDESESVLVDEVRIRAAMDSEEPILFFDAIEGSNHESATSIADFEIRAGICAPLIDERGDSFGALQIESTGERGQFVEEDIDLLSSITSQIGIAIAKARTR